MRLGKIIVEDRISGNRERRESLGLHWLDYSARKFDLGQAIVAAEEQTGRDVKVGMWKGRRVPGNVVLVGKFSGDAEDAELPLYVVAGTQESAPAAPPEDRGRRLPKTERLLVKVATRLIRLENQATILKWVTLLSLVISLSAIGVSLLLLWRVTAPMR